MFNVYFAGDYDPFFDSEMHMSGSDCFGISDKYFIVSFTVDLF